MIGSFLSILSISVALLSPLSEAAESSPTKNGIFIGLGMARRGYSGDLLSGEYVLINNLTGSMAVLPDFNPGLGYYALLGGRVSLGASGFAQNLAASAHIGFGMSEHEGKWLGGTFDASSLAVDVTGSLIYAAHPFQPFVSIAARSHFLKVQDGFLVGQKWPIYIIKSIEDYTLYGSGIGLGLGANYYVSNRLIFFASMEWFFQYDETIDCSSEGESAIEDSVIERMMEFRAGIQYVFWKPGWLL